VNGDMLLQASGLLKAYVSRPVLTGVFWDYAEEQRRRGRGGLSSSRPSASA